MICNVFDFPVNFTHAQCVADYLRQKNPTTMAATKEKFEYFEYLNGEDKKDYLAKLTLSPGEQIPDPFILHSNWSDDVSLLPDITYLDIYHYLIEYPSQFSKESLKAYKSLESYNLFVSRHVQNVYYHEVKKKSKFCFIKTEVRN